MPGISRWPSPLSRADVSENLVWRWPAAAFGALCAVPAGIVVASDPSKGFALAVGVLPAALVGVLPKRRARSVLVVFGVLVGVPMFAGGALAGVPVLAVAAIAALGVGTAALARRSRIGQVTMTVSLPLVGVGLSYDDIGEAATLGGLMIAASVFACALSMLWPEHPEGKNGPAKPSPPTLGYGVRLGLAGATAAAIGFLFDFDHVGWACAAALLVMRPVAEMQRLRSVGRIVAVIAGALAAIGLVRLDPAAGWLGLAAVAAVTGAAATRGSRWYVTPAFTTFLVFLLLLHSSPADAGSRFAERLLETALGVGLAYLFGLALPALFRSRTTANSSISPLGD